MQLLEFVSMLEKAQLPYDTFHVEGATYVEVGKHFGYRFNVQGKLSGGWILPPVKEDHLAEWQEWRTILQ